MSCYHHPTATPTTLLNAPCWTLPNIHREAPQQCRRTVSSYQPIGRCAGDYKESLYDFNITKVALMHIQGSIRAVKDPLYLVRATVSSLSGGWPRRLPQRSSRCLYMARKATVQHATAICCRYFKPRLVIQLCMTLPADSRGLERSVTHSARSRLRPTLPLHSSCCRPQFQPKSPSLAYLYPSKYGEPCTSRAPHILLLTVARCK